LWQRLGLNRGTLARIAVLGLGYVGLTNAIGLASLGHSVVGIDIDSSRVGEIRSGRLPFFEVGLEKEMLLAFEMKKLEIYSSFEYLNNEIEYVFVCVATPEGESGKADLTFVESAIALATPRLSQGTIIVMKSTLPIGTAQNLSNELSGKNLEVVSSPEFLAEGSALYDFHNPSRIVIGADNPQAAKSVLELFASISAPRVLCSLTSAETIKHASNSFLALKLSYINELAAICNRTGALMSEVTLGMSLDPRIGEKFLRPGPGWGGSCFPKDTSELANTAKQLGAPMLTVEAAIASNAETKTRVIRLIQDQLGGTVMGKNVAIWGLAFKAMTDDIRESPAVEIMNTLLDKGAIVRAFDPIAKISLRENLNVTNSALDACAGAQALVVLTEWSEFSLIDPNDLRTVMAQDPKVIDTRGLLDSTKWSQVFPNFMTLAS
jgi:UDPglucose 6-dehydrogenase